MVTVPAEREQLELGVEVVWQMAERVRTIGLLLWGLWLEVEIVLLPPVSRS